MSVRGRQEGSGEATGGPAGQSGRKKELLDFYGRTFRDLHLALEESGELDFFFQMHSTEEALQSVPQSGSEVKLYPGGSYVLLHETLEDYRAAYLCFLNGFTRQAREILRNTFESVVRVYYIRYFQGQGEGEKEEIAHMADALRRLLALKAEDLSVRLKMFYSLLYGESSSGQDRLALPSRPFTKRAGGPGFDPVDILNMKGLFFSLLDFELRLLSAYLKEGNRTVWTPTVLSAISSILERVNKYRPTINRYEAGYLVLREPASLSQGVEVIYSVRTDGKTEYHRPGTRNLKIGQLKRLEDMIRKRLLADLY
jgi:hypothetical protein